MAESKGTGMRGRTLQETMPIVFRNVRMFVQKRLGSFNARFYLWRQQNFQKTYFKASFRALIVKQRCMSQCMFSGKRSEPDFAF